MSEVFIFNLADLFERTVGVGGTGHKRKVKVIFKTGVGERGGCEKRRWQKCGGIWYAWARKKIPDRQTEGRIYFYPRKDQRSWECDRPLRQAKEA